VCSSDLEVAMQNRSTLELAALEDRLVMDATALDLTARGSSGEVNGAFFVQYDARPTGTGYIQSFLRIQGASAKGVTQQGYNTDARPLQYDENKSPQFTRALQASEVPTVVKDGVAYKEFLLDINQKSSQPLLSLDQLRFYAGHAGNLTGYDPATHTLAGMTPVYDMDAGGDSWVKLDYRLNTGSGSGDMLLYVPAAAFAGQEYIYLYSKFGEHFAANSGFQEWARGTGGSLTPNTGSICGFVFADGNNNGVMDTGEVGLADKVVYIDANGNGEMDATEVYAITDSTGHYEFNVLMSGNYSIRTILDDGSSSLAADLFLAPGEDHCGVDFGIFRPQT